MTDESICLKCGTCCYTKHLVNQNGAVVALADSPCRHLDLETKLCEVYSERDQIKWCLSIEVAFEKGFLPMGCPYISYMTKKTKKQYLSQVEFTSEGDKYKV